MRFEGKTFQQIADCLNDEKIPAKRAGRGIRRQSKRFGGLKSFGPRRRNDKKENKDIKRGTTRRPISP